MSHIDPITGVRVLDWNEVIKPDEFQAMLENMDKDDRANEKDTKKDTRSIYKLLRQEGNDFGINIIKVIQNLTVEYKSGFRGSKTNVVSEILAYDEYFKRTIHGKVQIIQEEWSGSFYEPPDGNLEIFWLPKVSRVHVQAPRSSI